MSESTMNTYINMDKSYKLSVSKESKLQKDIHSMVTWIESLKIRQTTL